MIRLPPKHTGNNPIFEQAGSSSVGTDSGASGLAGVPQNVYNRGDLRNLQNQPVVRSNDAPAGIDESSPPVLGGGLDGAANASGANSSFGVTGGLSPEGYNPTHLQVPRIVQANNVHEFASEGGHPS